jgi:site-specific recombinase XerD
MKAKRYPARNNWRVLIPARFTDNGKQRARFFDTKTEADTEIRRILNRGNSSKPQVTEADEAAFTLAKDEGLSPHEYLEAIRLYKKMVGGIASEKRVDLQTACEAFIERQKRENRNRRTIYSDGQALKYLCEFAGWKLPLIELTEARINEYFDTMKPGGRRRTQHSRVKKFLNWCTETGYLVLNPMAKIKPREKWNSNREILDIEAFRRILFVIAGLEPTKPGEVPTLRYQRLLPFYVLGGMAGLRRRELISSDPSDPVIEWTDIWCKRNLIEIREEVAKQTGAADHRRWPPLEPAAKEWLRMVAKPNGRIIEISQSTLQRLNDELLDALKLEVPENGLRNSYASYGLSFRSPGDVSKAMGDNEATVLRYYIKKLEPDAGQAWFGVRPG